MIVSYVFELHNLLSLVERAKDEHANTWDGFKAIFESSLQSILPRFSLTELKDEQMMSFYYLLSGKDVVFFQPSCNK